MFPYKNLIVYTVDVFNVWVRVWQERQRREKGERRRNRRQKQGKGKDADTTTVNRQNRRKLMKTEQNVNTFDGVGEVYCQCSIF